jgi:hypothetical protein
VGCDPKDTSPGPQPATNAETAWFEEVADRVGIRFQHESGHLGRHYFPEIMGGGVGLLDYDNDGDLDVYLVQSGSLEPTNATKSGNRLYRNSGDGMFEDVTEGAGVGDLGYGMGCACGDYDGDGHVDVYVTNVGPNVLYRNLGDGTFAAVTAFAGVGDPAWGTSASFLDYDRDGFLDLVVVNYINWSREIEEDCTTLGKPSYCSPDTYRAPARDTLYRNRGDGTFEDVTTRAGMTVFGNGLGVACGDFNLDGFDDVYIANDVTMNQLWLNTGKGTFVDRALISGCAVNIAGHTEAGMGVIAVDAENDGDLDLFISHLRSETNTFYLNHGDWFEDVTALRGLAAPSLPFTGFGLGFVDFDNDGRLDVYVVNGRIERGEPEYDALDPYAEPDQLFRGQEDGRFQEVMPRGGTVPAKIGTSRGAAFGDIDNDGGVDIVVVNRDHRPFVLHNRVGARGQWIRFRVMDRRGVDAIGARVMITAKGRQQWRQVQPASSYCASNDPRVHFGLGTATQVDDVTVHWPSGDKRVFGPHKTGQTYDLRQE